MKTTIRVSHDDFDAGAEIRAAAARSPASGAVASFVGIVRNHNDGESILGMSLEHYPGMTEKALEGIFAKARERWSLDDVTVIHRVGDLKLGDQIVLCLVCAAHRREAFEACEYIMDWLKTEAPFWKKEQTAAGSRWVDARESDEAAKARWQKQ